MLLQLNDQNDEYLELLFDWQKLEIYDEVDKLVFKLVQHYARTLEAVLSHSYRDMDQQLQRYQAMI
jgi:hypothetical protein